MLTPTLHTATLGNAEGRLACRQTGIANSVKGASKNGLQASLLCNYRVELGTRAVIVERNGPTK